ncbi:hypothetical protein L1987_06754 [Smallanthus sonchifolius]|uniref:Uncharacterized protein n=1 Tax=Smallanthus sonchifolius TaxID=185202 RepID=A0ACB9JZ78_9ASTR|nr:hypothetical protein L1987_06754 [Smallanthus sonchifolius]
MMWVADFSVKRDRERIDEYSLPSSVRKTTWFACFPRKINICGWRVGKSTPYSGESGCKGETLLINALTSASPHFPHLRQARERKRELGSREKAREQAQSLEDCSSSPLDRLASKRERKQVERRRGVLRRDGYSAQLTSKLLEFMLRQCLCLNVKTSAATLCI